LIQVRCATESWYYGLTCTFQSHSYYAIIKISPVKLFHPDFYSGSNEFVSRPFFRYPNLKFHIHKFRFRLHRRLPQMCNKYIILNIPCDFIYFPSAVFTYKKMCVNQPALWIYLLNNPYNEYYGCNILYVSKF
jgi:hypothetical protein